MKTTTKSALITALLLFATCYVYCQPPTYPGQPGTNQQQPGTSPQQPGISPATPPNNLQPTNPTVPQPIVPQPNPNALPGTMPNGSGTPVSPAPAPTPPTLPNNTYPNGNTGTTGPTGKK